MGKEFYHTYKRKEPWVWDDCGLTFSKVSGDVMKFVVRRKKNIDLYYDAKKPVNKNDTPRDSNQAKEKHSYTLKYFIKFEVPLNNLSSEIIEGSKKLGNKEDSVEKDSWIIKLNEHHHIWMPKDAPNADDNVISKISKEIEKKKLGNYVSDTLSFATPLDINNDLIPVICHPARDFNTKELEHKNFVREIHLCQDKGNKKIHATIVFTGERLRKHWVLYYIYKAIRLIAYGRTFDIESFNIIPYSQDKIKFDFPHIYSQESNIYDDDVHNNRCAVDARYYLDCSSHPMLFVNTANHAMAESDSNFTKWKVEYSPWEKDCPVFLGQEKRCDIEKRVRVITINPFLLGRCDDSKYESCSDK